MGATTTTAAWGSAAGCFVIAMAIAAVVAAAISLAALVDPFDWMPTAAQIWADCEGDCELAHRFPGFWWHALANLVYAAIAAAAAVAVAFGATVLVLRAARTNRFASPGARAAYRKAADACRGAALALAAVAAFPLIVWVA
jgi:hypothetical protein